MSATVAETRVPDCGPPPTSGGSIASGLAAGLKNAYGDYSAGLIPAQNSSH